MIVAAAQCRSAPLEVRTNLDTVARLTRQAAEAGARLLVFPELFLTGPTFDSRLWEVAPRPDDRVEEQLAALAQAEGVHLVVGTAERRRDHLYNTALLVAPGHPVQRYSKSRLFGADAFAFRRRPAARPEPWATALGRIGVGICYEMLFAEPWATYAGRVDLVTIPSAWPDFRGAQVVVGGLGIPVPPTPATRLARGWIKHLSGRISGALGVPVVRANHLGEADVTMLMRGFVARVTFPGSSGIHDGERFYGRSDGQEGLAMAEVAVGERRPTARPYAGASDEPAALDMRLVLAFLSAAEGVGDRAVYPVARALGRRRPSRGCSART